MRSPLRTTRRARVVKFCSVIFFCFRGLVYYENLFYVTHLFDHVIMILIFLAPICPLSKQKAPSDTVSFEMII